MFYDCRMKRLDVRTAQSFITTDRGQTTIIGLRQFTILNLNRLYHLSYVTQIPNRWHIHWPFRSVLVHVFGGCQRCFLLS